MVVAIDVPVDDDIADVVGAVELDCVELAVWIWFAGMVVVAVVCACLDVVLVDP